MGGLSAAFTTAGIAMNSYQSYYDAQVKKLEAELAASGMEAEADRKDIEAEAALKLGELGQAEKLAEGRTAVAAKRTEYAASGVKVYSGSAAETAADMTAWNEYERQKIEYEAAMQSWGLSYDAALLRYNAANTRATGSASASSSLTQSLVSGSSGLASLFK